MSTRLLEMRGITKSFSGVTVLRGIDLDVEHGRVLGLVGENGAGKSTLVNVLGGVLDPDRGTLKLDGTPYAPRGPADASERGIAFIHQELDLFPRLSIAENIRLASFPRWRAGSIALPVIHRRRLRDEAARLLERVGITASPDTLVERLAPGERQLVEIARALSVEARLILLDEPTTSLSRAEAERLFELLESLRETGVAMIYISHVLEDVIRLSDELAVLRDGEVVGRGRRGAIAPDRLVELMVGRNVERLYPSRADAPGSDIALETRHLTRAGVIHDISFDTRRGEVLGVAGLMGSGRTELARIIFGLDPCDGGEVLVAGELFSRRSPRAALARGVALVTEDRRSDGLLLDASVAENITLASFGAARGRLGLLRPRRLLEQAAELAQGVRLRSRDLARQRARTLSGGNQQKLVLARSIAAAPRVLILDEPTRGIDVGAREEIYALIRDLARRGAGILLISSEIEELIGLADRILVLRRGEIGGSFRRESFDRERILRAAIGREDAA